MKILFKDDLFDAQLLRAFSHVYSGGADVGECITTGRRIAEGDAESWYREWLLTAERIDKAGEDSLAGGHRASAREAFLRASNYYRTAYTFLTGSPVDPRLVQAFDWQTDAFRKAAELFSPPFETISIPYANTNLPGYFFRVDDSGRRRPTLILTGGYDGTAEESYFFGAAAALRRGYNCVSFDGPGQGAALIKQGLVFRPDWENVVGPVVDYALSRPEVDPQRIVLLGLSFGGYLAPRAASGEHRLAACIADPGEVDLLAAIKDRMPAFFARQIPDGNRIALAVLQFALRRLSRHPTRGWAMRRGMWVHGVPTPLDYVCLTKDYTLRGLAEQITCPTLVCFAEHDDIAAYARQLFDTLQCQKQFVTFTSAEGRRRALRSGQSLVVRSARLRLARRDATRHGPMRRRGNHTGSPPSAIMLGAGSNRGRRSTRKRAGCTLSLAVFCLVVARPLAAYAHGQGVPFAFWGDFPSQAARCQNVLAYAATRCVNRVWKFHTDCFSALLDGNVCGVSILVDPVQGAHLDSLNLIDLLCTSPAAQALGFLLKYEAQTDMNNFCYAIENALVSVVYGPVMSGHPPDDRTRTCVEAMARATTKLWRFAVRARRHALDEIARRSMTPGDKQALIDESSTVIENLQGLIQKKLEAVCVTTDFAETYHHDDSELLTLVGQRADCLAAAVYVQNAVFCPLPVCGNGMQEVGEQCDDGNLVDGDGCSSHCTAESPTPPSR